MKSFFLIFLTLSLWLTTKAQTYSGGAGTIVNPYQIANKLDLKYLSENSTEWNKHFVQTADIVFDQSDFQVGGNFYNGGEGFIPIGNSSITFTGSYNGQNYSVINLDIDRPLVAYYVGFFGLSGGGAELTNIRIINANVIGNNDVGGLCGFANFVTVENCFVSGIITGNNNVGGVCGIYSGYLNDSYMTNCEVNAQVNGNEDVGGICGRTTLLDTEIYKSIAFGAVTGNSRVGGFIGYNNARIYNCYSQATVEGDENIGGFCGNNSGSINKCYSSGEVTGVSNIGGFCGINFLGVNDCFWDTQTSGQATSAGGIGLPTSQMQQQLTFTDDGWDFVGESINGTMDNWIIFDCPNMYPRLAWENVTGTFATQASITETRCDSYESPSGNYTWSTSGTYYDTIPNAAGCDSLITIELTILETPNIDVLSDLAACDSYELPALTTGNYFTETNGGGTQLNEGDLVSATQTLYVYAENGTCSDESSFVITIDESVSADIFSDLTACDSYELPALTTGNYFTETNGGGTQLNAGDLVDATQTVYVYAANGTCSDETSFTVTINENPDNGISQNDLTLSANATGANYVWVDCNNAFAPIAGETAQSFTATENGSYAVQVSANGCEVVSECVEITTVGVLENSFGNNLRIYPNPTSGNFSIDLGEVYANSEVRITDLSGKLIGSKSFTQSQVLDLSLEAAEGVYCVTVLGNEKISVIQLVKR